MGSSATTQALIANVVKPAVQPAKALVSSEIQSRVRAARLAEHLFVATPRTTFTSQARPLDAR